MKEKKNCKSKNIGGTHTTRSCSPSPHSCFPVLLFVLHLFLLLYIHPTALTADAAAEVAAPWLLLPLSPLPPHVCTPNEMRVEGDGVRWWDDVGVVVVMVGLGIHKCEWAEGLRACQHSPCQ